MRASLSLIGKEFAGYFLSPVAYVVLAVFLAVTGHLFYLTLVQLTASGPKGVEFPLQLMLGDEKFWLVYLFIPPLLTMRLFAEERATGTLEMLMTAPLSDWQVVLSKFIACFGFYIVLWLPLVLYLPVLIDLHWRPFYAGIDPMPIWSSCLGLATAGAMFLALGLWVSSMVRSQMVAALVAMFLSLGFILVGIWRPDMDTGGTMYRVLFFFSVPLHFYRDFTRGLIDTRHIILYVSVTALCLFLTVRSLESRRWR